MKKIEFTGKTADRLEQANSAMGSMFIAAFALIMVIWLCHNTSAGLMTLDPQQASDVRGHDVNVLRSLGLI